MVAYMRQALIALCVTVLQLASTSSVRCQEDPDTEIARRYFAAGQQAYEAADYDRALDRFHAAQRVKPLPAFDYNIARCLDRMDRPAEAVAAYERFLAAEPGATNAAELRARIRVLRRRSSGALPEPTASTTRQDEPRRARSRRYLAPGLVLGGAVLVAGVAAGIVGSVAPALAEVERRWDLGGRTEALVADGLALERRAIAGYALFGVAGALAVTDAVLWGLAVRRSRASGAEVHVRGDALTVRF